MSKRDAVVAAKIITPEQRRAIDALDDDSAAFKLSMVPVLWTGGVALVIVALLLLAAEIGQGHPVRLNVV